jgi:hypothetical protein
MQAVRLPAIAIILVCPVCAGVAGDWETVGPRIARPANYQNFPWDPAPAETPPAAQPWEEFTNLLKQSEPTFDPWQGLRYNPGRLKLTRESIVETAKVQSTLELADYRELRQTPWRGDGWRAENSLNVPLPAAESLFVFGKFDSTGEVDDNRHVRMTGKTGLGWKWAPFAKSEVQFRSGPVMNVSDVYNPLRPQQKSQLSVELQAKTDLFGPLQLQYSGEALPALLDADRHTILQDLKLAVPFGSNREFHIGAKYRWQDLSPLPWLDRTQLYLGLKFQH